MAGSLVRPLWSRRTWLATVHAVTGLPLGILTFTVAFSLTTVTAGLLVTAVFAVPTLLLLLGCLRVFTALQRSRFAALLDVDIPAPAPVGGARWTRRVLAATRAPDTWRQLAYHLLALPVGVVGFVMVTTSWALGLSLVAAPLYGWGATSGTWLVREVPAPAVVAAATVAGFALLLASPWVARCVAAVDTAAALALLGPSRHEELTRRVEELAGSRAGVVDAADAERRRIERDLHDGAQQRLVSLAMNLGRARMRCAEAPEPARRAIEEAHEEAKQALAELRDFVRGLHPVVLDDRGLDAALSGIVARTPLPVRLRVDVPARCCPTVEAIAYFVVAEALTNVVKHAEASRAEVTVVRTAGRLCLTIADDGRGGAVPGGGTGLRGLAQRAAAVDGTLRIDSPAGGPTRIEVSLPCES